MFDSLEHDSVLGARTGANRPVMPFLVRDGPFTSLT